MKRALPFILLLMISTWAIRGQSLSKSFGYYDDKKYEKAMAGFTSAISSKKDLPVAYFGMALCFINKDTRYKNYDSAYYYANQSFEAFKKEGNDEYYPIKYGINQDSASNLKKRADKCLYDEVIASGNLKAAQHFVSSYPNSEYAGKVSDILDELAFKEASTQNTAAAYEEFCKSYPKSKHFAQAKELSDKLMYESLTSANTYQAYQQFCEKYPQSPFYTAAKEKYELLLYKSMTQANSLAEYEKFCTQYPKSPYWTVAQDSIYKMSVRQGDVNSYNQFVARHPESPYASAVQDSLLRSSVKQSELSSLERYVIQYPTASNLDKVIHSIYGYYAQSGDLSDLEIFEKKYPGKETQALQKDKELAGQGLNLFDKNNQHNNNTLIDFIKKEAPRDIALFALQELIKSSIDTKDWNTALTTVKQFAPVFGNNDKFEELRRVLQQNEAETEPEKIDAINTSGNEYNPIISEDGKSLYFCANGRTDNIGGDDIFVSKMMMSWQRPSIVPVLSTANYNDIPTALSGSGNDILLSQNGDIYISHKTATGWTLPQPLSDKINTQAWESDGTFAANGKAVLFVSDRKGNIGFDHEKDQNYAGTGCGNTDIYVSVKTTQGWSKPINLGNVVNTPFGERAPYLHPDMKTLYFCSNGRGGLGDFDVYKTTRLYDTSWCYWSKPVNLGKYINTSGADIAYTFSTDGEYAYYSQSVNNKKDIYRIKLPIPAKPNQVFPVTGKVNDSNKKPVDAIIRWENMENGEILGESSSDPVEGSFFLALPSGKSYGYYVEKENYFPVSNHIDLRSGRNVISADASFTLISFADMIKNGTLAPLNNVFFNAGDYHLMTESNTELNRLAELLKKNMSLRVEISGYSDAGTAGGDMLSYQRASEVGNYLIQRGCKTENISVVASASVPKATATKAPVKKGAKAKAAPAKKGAAKGKVAAKPAVATPTNCIQIKFIGY